MFFTSAKDLQNVGKEMVADVSVSKYLHQIYMFVCICRQGRCMLVAALIMLYQCMMHAELLNLLYKICHMPLQKLALAAR